LKTEKTCGSSRAPSDQIDEISICLEHENIIKATQMEDTETENESGSSWKIFLVHDVLYVPDGTATLLSAGVIQDKGN
jgi:hypothetical protein